MAIKLSASLFFVLLLCAHSVEEWNRPLSQFRDGLVPWLGYLLFAILFLISSLYAIRLSRSERLAEMGIVAFAIVLLVLIAVTPSIHGLHEVSAALLFLVLYGYYSILLFRANGIAFAVHVVIPLVLLVVAEGHSYGLWQKSFISYFVVLAVLHEDLVARYEVPSKPRRHVRVPTQKRRKVYQLVEDRPWARRGMVSR